MNIFLLGSQGYLGSYLQKHLNADTEIQKDKIYDYFINCAGKPVLEYCEEHPEESYVSNFDVIRQTHKQIPEAKIISFSSYYVYDDIGYCSEKSNTTNEYNYTKHKLQAEEYVTENGGVSFRIGKLFGNPESQQTKLTDVFLKANKITLDKVLFNPAAVKQVLSVVQYELDTSMFTGIYNLSNKGVTSHLDYCKYIDDYLQTTTEISIIEQMPKRFHSYGRFLMSVEKLESLFSLVPWQEDLREYLGCIVSEI